MAEGKKTPSSPEKKISDRLWTILGIIIVSVISAVYWGGNINSTVNSIQGSIEELKPKLNRVEESLGGSGGVYTQLAVIQNTLNQNLPKMVREEFQKKLRSVRTQLVEIINRDATRAQQTEKATGTERSVILEKRIQQMSAEISNTIKQLDE